MKIIKEIYKKQEAESERVAVEALRGRHVEAAGKAQRRTTTYEFPRGKTKEIAKAKEATIEAYVQQSKIFKTKYRRAKQDIDCCKKLLATINGKGCTKTKERLEAILIETMRLAGKELLDSYRGHVGAVNKVNEEMFRLCLMTSAYALLKQPMGEEARLVGSVNLINTIAKYREKTPWFFDKLGEDWPVRHARWESEERKTSQESEALLKPVFDAAREYFGEGDCDESRNLGLWFLVLTLGACAAGAIAFGTLGGRR